MAYLCMATRSRLQIEEFTFVRCSSTCSYFTIELKRTGASENVAVKLPAPPLALFAGALAVYNPYRLRDETLKFPNAS